MIGAVRRNDTIVTTGGLDRKGHQSDGTGRTGTRNRPERARPGGAQHDLRSPGQGRACEGGRGLGRSADRAGRRTTLEDHDSLRTLEGCVHHPGHAHCPDARDPKHAAARHAAGAEPCRAVAPGPHGRAWPRPAGGAHVLLEVDTPSVIRTKVEALRDDVRRALREENVRHDRAALACRPRGCSCASPTLRDRAKLLPRLRALAAPLGASLTGAVSEFTVTEQDDGVDPACADRRGHRRPGAPGGRPVDRGAAPPRRRAGHHGAEHPAPGRRPYSRRSAGPAGPAAPEGHSRYHGEARIPPRCRSGREPRRFRDPAALQA